jgi:hypothetical protein
MENWTKEDYSIAIICACQLGWCSLDSQEIAKELENRFDESELKWLYKEISQIRKEQGVDAARRFYMLETNK